MFEFIATICQSVSQVKQLLSWESSLEACVGSWIFPALISVAGVVARSEGDQPSALTPALATIQSHQQRVAHWIFSECFWITTIKQWENSFICGWSPNVLKFAADFCKTNNPIYRLLLWPPSIYLVVLIDTRSCLSVDWLILVPHSCVEYWLTYKKSTPHSGSNLN